MTYHSSLTIKANFVIRVPPSTYAEWWETNLLQIQMELARNLPPHQYNKYSAKQKADIRYTAQKTANPRELLCHDSHLWWLALASHCSPQLGKQCFAKYGFMVEYMDSWPQEIKCFSFIMMRFLQLATQGSNSSWWHHDSQKIQTLVNN